MHHHAEFVLHKLRHVAERLTLKLKDHTKILSTQVKSKYKGAISLSNIEKQIIVIQLRLFHPVIVAVPKQNVSLNLLIIY